MADSSTPADLPLGPSSLILAAAADSMVVVSTVTDADGVGGYLTGPEVGSGAVYALAEGGAPLHGSVRIAHFGQFVYEPEAGYEGPDGFTFTVTDALGTITTATVTIALAAEGPTTIQGIAGNDVLIGGAGANEIDGGSGADSLFGGLGSDTLSGGAGDDWLQGDGGADTLLGGEGHDRLRGDAGDRLDGGTGNDMYLVGAGVTIQEDTGGIDEVRVTGASMSIRLSSGIENLLVDHGSWGVTATGNDLSNRMEVAGTAGYVEFRGGGGDDTLLGGAGSDTLNGGTGRDWLVGGQQSDTYIVDSAGDVVVETGTMGIDSVISTVGWKLGSGVEVLVLRGPAGLSGTGNGLSNTLKGNGGDNLLSGLGGTDTVLSGAGGDRVDGGAGGDTLFGEGGNDVLLGRSGDDSLIGAAGRDTLTGGSGADVFYFEDGQDVVRDFQNNLDTIVFDDALWGGKLLSEDAVLSFARVVQGSAVFDFGEGDVLVVQGVDSLNVLRGDLGWF